MTSYRTTAVVIFSAIMLLSPYRRPRQAGEVGGNSQLLASASVQASTAEGCGCQGCGAPICRSACSSSDCSRCCRCCVYFDLRVGRRSDFFTSAAARYNAIGNSGIQDIDDVDSGNERNPLIAVDGIDKSAFDLVPSGLEANGAKVFDGSSDKIWTQSDNADRYEGSQSAPLPATSSYREDYGTGPGSFDEERNPASTEFHIPAGHTEKRQHMLLPAASNLKRKAGQEAVTITCLWRRGSSTLTCPTRFAISGQRALTEATSGRNI